MSFPLLQVHRAFLLASLFLGVTGFILPFVANYNRIPHGLIQLGTGNVRILCLDTIINYYHYSWQP